MSEFQHLEDIKHRLSHVEQLATTGRVAASVAHEINNILQSVLLHLSATVESVPDDVVPHLELSLRETERASEMARWLLEGVRPDHEVRRPTDLMVLLEEALSLAAGQTKSSQVEVHIEAESGLSPVPVATGALRQVFLNLILNAVEAMPNGGRLDIILRSSRDQAQITFEDDGVGIAPEDLQHIFEPFFTRKETGSGLGLWVCQDIVGAHGGHIDVRSEPNGGTTVTVNLPLNTS